jgi:hypothetical protein
MGCTNFHHSKERQICLVHIQLLPIKFRIKCIPFPLPRIQAILLKLEGFQFATSLDQNMVYYHIELSPFSKSLCTIIVPWVKYEYHQLPMVLCNSPDNFQEIMSSLVNDLQFVETYCMIF